MKIFLVMMLFFVGLGASAQKQHQATDQLRSMNWDIIGSVKFELNDKNELIPHFSEAIKRFDNKDFELLGYLIPLKTGRKQQRFLFSTLPINQCFFCGKNGIPVMIMVEMANPINYSEQPIKVKGMLKLEQKDASYSPPITIKNANLVG